MQSPSVQGTYGMPPHRPQLRLPEDGAYSDAMVMIGGMEASVLRPDLEANSDALVQFIYEDDTPKMTQ